MYHNKLLAIMLISFIIFVSGCVDDGEENSEIVVPTDLELNLYCENVGIYPETCVMDDEDNPYRFVSVDEESKWDLSSGYPKADFYLWATALASQSMGENQFNVAENLHKLYTINGSEIMKIQTIKAYKSVLENFYDSQAARWNSEGVFITDDFLRDKTGQRLYGFWGESDENNIARMKAGGMVLENLFETKSHAKSTMNDWGYVFDHENGIIIQ
jgi:hypothetical protein